MHTGPTLLKHRLKTGDHMSIYGFNDDRSKQNIDVATIESDIDTLQGDVETLQDDVLALQKPTIIDASELESITSGANIRNLLGLGNTLNALPIANGGTGESTLNDFLNKANLGEVKTYYDNYFTVNNAFTQRSEPWIYYWGNIAMFAVFLKSVNALTANTTVTDALRFSPTKFSQAPIFSLILPLQASYAVKIKPTASIGEYIDFYIADNIAADESISVYILTLLKSLH